jgi:hypothetical protein
MQETPVMQELEQILVMQVLQEILEPTELQVPQEVQIRVVRVEQQARHH